MVKSVDTDKICLNQNKIGKKDEKMKKDVYLTLSKRRLVIFLLLYNS